MKLQNLSLIFAVLVFTSNSHAEGWLDSIKDFIGMEAKAQTEIEKPAMPNISDMVAAVTDQLGVNKSQATGGLGSIFNYAKDNLSGEQFSSISSALPGLSRLLSAAPNVSELASEGGIAGLMDKAASYNDSLKALNDIKKQFAILGLKPEMISQFIVVTQQYLETDEGKKIQDTLMQGLDKLVP
ncbi:DUF2780 domain-containing protein [Paraglaciecola sp.]|uniref:DUF2780 domain-containing protein n=1 Tax=Paraglaciecola sp. TaxID=1920173 RepID=UPI0030F4141A